MPPGFTCRRARRRRRGPLKSAGEPRLEDRGRRGDDLAERERTAVEARPPAVCRSRRSRRSAPAGRRAGRGRCRSASPLISRVSPTTRTTWSAACRRHRVGRTRRPRAVVGGVVVRRLLVAGRAALGVHRRAGRSVLHALQHADGVLVAPLAPPGPRMSCWSSPGRPMTAVSFAGSSGSVLSSFWRAPSTGEAAIARRRAVGGGPEAAGVGRLGLVDVGVLEETGAELTRRMRRTASSSRDIVIRCWASSCCRSHGCRVLPISESVPAISAFAPALGPSAAVPWPRPLVGRPRRAGADLRDGGVVALDETVRSPTSSGSGSRCRSSRSPGRR